MKKILILSLFFVFAGSVCAQEARFPSSQAKEIDVYINSGKLIVKSADTKEVSVSIEPQNQDFLNGVRLLGERKLLVMAKDLPVDSASVVTITVPLRSDVEIDSIAADIVAENLSGDLDINSERGSVLVKNFNGDFDIDTHFAEVRADGVFRDLSVETSAAEVFITLNSLPVFYEYDLEGSGNVTFLLSKGVSKKKLKLDMEDFRGNVKFQDIK